MSSVVVEHGVRAQVRREGARARRERRLRSEARVRLRLARDAMLIASHRGGAGSDSGSFIDNLVRRVQALETSLANVDFQVFSAGAVEAMFDERIEGVRAVLSGSLEDLFEKRLASSLSSTTSDRDLLASLDALLCDVSEQFDAKVSSVADSCCAISDKFESHVATLTVSCANLDAQVKSLSESCRRYADDVAQESCLPLKEQMTEVQNQLSRVLDWKSLFDDCVGDPDNIRQTDRMVLTIFNVLSEDPEVRDLLVAEDFRLAYGE